MIKMQPLLALALAFSASLAAAPEYPRALEPDPARMAGEVARLVAGDAESPPPKGAVVCAGSSSMRIWAKRMQEDLPGLTIIPRGFGGSQFTDLIHFADELILQYEPRAVAVYEGDNDIASGKTPERIRDDLRFLVEYCRAKQPDLRFYVIGIKPSVRRAAIWDKAAEANAAMREYCESIEGATYIDVSAGMLLPDGAPRDDIFVDDQLHLNDLGYDVWAAAIAPVLLRAELPRER